jgi:Skp family chaperone for outer membrane proteins
MKHAERVVIYAGLGLCLALAAGFPGPGAVATASRPATVEPKPVRIATLDLGKLIVDQYQLSESYKAARAAEEAKMKPLQDLLLGMRTRLEKLDQKSPEFQAEIPIYQAKVQELQEVENAVQAFSAKQVAQATKEIAAAAKVVADASGYSHVLLSRPVDAEFRLPNPDGALAEALQRTVLVGEAGTDITEAVRKELKLPPPITVTPVGPVGPAAAPASNVPTPPPAAPAATPPPAPATTPK